MGLHLAKLVLLACVSSTVGFGHDLPSASDRTEVKTTTVSTASADVASLLSAANRQKEALITICQQEHFYYTTRVQEAYLAYAKAQAKYELAEQNQSLPDEFLAWIDSDAFMEATVYGMPLKPSQLLLMLYSLRLDLGKPDFEKYRQLAMAAAIVDARGETEANITQRGTLTLNINGDPRKPVDTTDQNRTFDMNDHIINFLNENTIVEYVPVDQKQPLPELKYDNKGIFIPPTPNNSEKKQATTKRTRSLQAADVLASRSLQLKFNEYMKSKGHPVDIDCGDGVVHWKSRDMVRGTAHKNLAQAYMLFRKAYEAKGLLPAKRDPIPSLAERCAYLIRNDKQRFPPQMQTKLKWPRFPLVAPWPLLTMLVSNNQPLREREERWQAFCNTGEFITYGEYIGSIAQQFDMQSARRLTPYPYTYGSIQMMLKDGGVCGAMANISVRSHSTLGIPACTAGQPGHCALISYNYDTKNQVFVCKGGQYATGGHDKTTPHASWLFEGEYGVEGKNSRRRPMVYHQTIAWSVNHGLRGFLDSTMAYSVFKTLSDSDRNGQGGRLLMDGIERNPYNFLLIDKVQQLVKTPQAQIQIWKSFRRELKSASRRPGCPDDDLYQKTVKKRLYVAIEKLPAPTDKEMATAVLDFLKAEKCDNAPLLVKYHLASNGIEALLIETEQGLKVHLNSIKQSGWRGDDATCAYVASAVKEAAGCIQDKEHRKEWASRMWQHTKGYEKYFGSKYRLNTHPVLPALARLSGQKMPTESELIQPVLVELAKELKTAVLRGRTAAGCKELSAKINSASGKVVDLKVKRKWLETLAAIIAGKELYLPAGVKNGKQQRDPCAATIEQALKSLAA